MAIESIKWVNTFKIIILCSITESAYYVIPRYLPPHTVFSLSRSVRPLGWQRNLTLAVNIHLRADVLVRTQWHLRWLPPTGGMFCHSLMTRLLGYLSFLTGKELEVSSGNPRTQAVLPEDPDTLAHCWFNLLPDTLAVWLLQLIQLIDLGLVIIQVQLECHPVRGAIPEDRGHSTSPALSLCDSSPPMSFTAFQHLELLYSSICLQ